MKAEVVWAKALWEVFEELPQKGKLPRLWNAWISSDTSPHTYPLRTRGWLRRHRFFSGRQLARIL